MTETVTIRRELLEQIQQHLSRHACPAPSNRDGKLLGAELRAALAAPVQAAGIPAAEWRVKGEPDPHAGQYDCERAALTKGELTDDMLANGLYLYDHRGGLESIVWLTAAKERIRWLSRKLEQAIAGHALAKLKAAPVQGEAVANEREAVSLDMTEEEFERLNRQSLGYTNSREVLVRSLIGHFSAQLRGYATPRQPAEVGELVEALRAEFPLFDDEGLDQEKHHCEWAMQQDRKRLHRLIAKLEGKA